MKTKKKNPRYLKILGTFRVSVITEKSVYWTTCEDTEAVGLSPSCDTGVLSLCARGWQGSERAPPGLTEHAKWAMLYDNCSGQSLTTLTACSALTPACPEVLWPPKEHPSFGICCRWRSSCRFHQPGTSVAFPGQRGSSCPRHCCGMPSPLSFLPHPMTTLFFSVSQAKCPGVHVCFPGHTTETALSKILHSQDREVT